VALVGAAVLWGWLLAPGATAQPSFTGTYRDKGHDLRLLQCGRRIVGAITGFADAEVQGPDLWNGVRATAKGPRAEGAILYAGTDDGIRLQLEEKGLRLRNHFGVRLTLSRVDSVEPEVPPERYGGDGRIERDGWSVAVPLAWRADRKADPLVMMGRRGEQLYVWSVDAEDEAGVRTRLDERLRALGRIAQGPLTLTPPSRPLDGEWNRGLGGGLVVRGAQSRQQSMHVIALFRPRGRGRGAVMVLGESGPDSPGCTRHRVESLAYSILFRRRP